MSQICHADARSAAHEATVQEQAAVAAACVDCEGCVVEQRAHVALQVTLGRMVFDMMKWALLFLLVHFAFSCGE